MSRGSRMESREVVMLSAVAMVHHWSVTLLGCSYPTNCMLTQQQRCLAPIPLAHYENSMWDCV